MLVKPVSQRWTTLPIVLWILFLSVQLWFEPWRETIDFVVPPTSYKVPTTCFHGPLSVIYYCVKIPCVPCQCEYCRYSWFVESCKWKPCLNGINGGNATHAVCQQETSGISCLYRNKKVRKIRFILLGAFSQLCRLSIWDREYLYDYNMIDEEFIMRSPRGVAYWAAWAPVDRRETLSLSFEWFYFKIMSYFLQANRKLDKAPLQSRPAPNSNYIFGTENVSACSTR